MGVLKSLESLLLITGPVKARVDMDIDTHRVTAAQDEFYRESGTEVVLGSLGRE